MAFIFESDVRGVLGGDEAEMKTWKYTKSVEGLRLVKVKLKENLADITQDIRTSMEVIVEGIESFQQKTK